MKNIVLIGFMGTGKTSTGKLLASRIGYSFVDTDNKIEQISQMTIRELFAQHGEAYFREKEAEMMQLVSRFRQTVISTGGGVVLNPQNMQALKDTGLIIALQASVDVIIERTSRRNVRPLLEQSDPRAAVVALMESRASLYGQADLTIDTSGISPLQVVEKIIDWLKKSGELHS